jgi:hypothetical protein
MKRTMTIVLALCLVAAAGFAAAKTDKDLLAGTWTVAQGIYSDGSLEKELEMEFTFTATTLTNPMSDGKAITYTIDEKAKTITSKDGDSTVWFHYVLVDATTMKFIEMKVTTPKGTTVIVGDKGTFKELDLKKK